jgi:hypothetical protein
MDDRTRKAPVPIPVAEGLLHCVQASETSPPTEGAADDKDEEMVRFSLTVDELRVLRLALEDYLQRWTSKEANTARS